ncbi:MAG: cyclomaltodextrinase N-terminal domain-containing protein, partial [Muribaculaceae bacterium]|nr:cyclomaltodextrinase N-terminal domain-containing protein [Muribaculaceae bacterium]
MNKKNYIEERSRLCRGLFRNVWVALGLAAAVMPGYAFDVNEIQPPHWWVGMKDSSLQLQIYGKDVRQSDVKINYPGVRLDSVARLDGSPDWQYLY